jgi:hypothetical protein
VSKLAWVYDDGGRSDAGFRGEASDCVCRSIAIATERAYREVYDALNETAKGEKSRRGRLGMLAATGRGSSARNGVWRDTIRHYMDAIGWEWVPTMRIGSGCTVHLLADELPTGRLVVSVSKHLTAVIVRESRDVDGRTTRYGTVHDTHDPRRDGNRCVYGYWREAVGA